jgi:hypothetical protein
VPRAQRDLVFEWGSFNEVELAAIVAELVADDDDGYDANGESSLESS